MNVSGKQYYNPLIVYVVLVFWTIKHIKSLMLHLHKICLLLIKRGGKEALELQKTLSLGAFFLKRIFPPYIEFNDSGG